MPANKRSPLVAYAERVGRAVGALTAIEFRLEKRAEMKAQDIRELCAYIADVLARDAADEIEMEAAAGRLGSLVVPVDALGARS